MATVTMFSGKNVRISIDGEPLIDVTDICPFPGDLHLEGTGEWRTSLDGDLFVAGLLARGLEQRNKVMSSYPIGWPAPGYSN